MALADRVTTRPRLATGFPCSVGVLLEKLTGAELAAFQEMLGTPERHGWPATAIYDAVTAEGHTIGRQSIGKHRRRQCRCFRDTP